VKDQIRAGHIVFTGPIDEYFGYRFGKLPYRSLRFEHQVVDQEQYPAGRGGQLPAPGRALHPDHRV
jgi:UDP-galactopyranose mutase